MINNSLQKFNQLSKDDRDFLSSPRFLLVIDKLESQYNIKLAMLFIELIVGDFLLENLNSRLSHLDGHSINDITGELQKLINDFNNKQSGYGFKLKTAISFSPEDDAEIKQIIFSSNVSTPLNDYDALAYEIITSSTYNVSGDGVMSSRLKNMIVARLKDIRDEMETLEALQKSRKIGGLEMTSVEAKDIMALIKEKISQGVLAHLAEKTALLPTLSFPQKRPFVKEKMTLAEKKNESIGAPKSELKKVIEGKVEKPILTLTPHIDEEDGLPVIKFPSGDDLMIRPKTISFNREKKILPPKSAENNGVLMSPVNSFKPIISKPAEIKAIAKPPIVVPQPQPQPSPGSATWPKSSRSDKPAVDGVRLNTVLVGPVEELGTMTLINFRRLGETPHQAMAKIKEKISILEKDSYAQKLAGIAAWHKNEINRFYRLLGQESMRQGRSIDDIINERLSQNKPTLSTEEFNSVMEINHSLRY